MDYILATQASAHRIDDDTFLTDGPFGKHLVELKERLPLKFKRIILFVQEMTELQVIGLRENVTIIKEKEIGIVFVSSHFAGDSLLDFWLYRSFKIWKESKIIFKNNSILHVDLATDIRRPMTAIVAKAARSKGRPICFVADIDFRLHAERARILGEVNILRYLLSKIQNKFKFSQLKKSILDGNLVLLKSPSMTSELGGISPNVKNFFDTVHSSEDILNSQEKENRVNFLRNSIPLRLCFFGRLVRYKGIDRMIEAISISQKKGHIIQLYIIGDGPEMQNLKYQVAELNLQKHVCFQPAASYGPALFNVISSCHVMVNAPLREDTPRAAFDAMARGLPILAFDISYFRDLSKKSNAVQLARWADSASLADGAIWLSENREVLVEMALNGLEFARENTQAIWLDRRIKWLEDISSQSN